MTTLKKVKRTIAWMGRHIIGRVRWLNVLVRVHNIDKNSYYDQLAELVMQKVLTSASICVDVGCSKGAILAMMMKYAPQGRFLAFEPLPDHYEYLTKTFTSGNVMLYQLALSDTTGTSSFNYVVTNPTYSGLRKRPYDRPYEEDRQIEVRTEVLDHILESESIHSVDFIKIDVEGGELAVLKGAANCLKRCKPTIVFEHGAAAARVYNTSSNALFDFLCVQCGLRIFLMQDWLLAKPALTREMFCDQVHARKNYYFMACQ
jgi:FkbM family methyltransferase